MRTAYRRAASSHDEGARNALIAEHTAMARRIALRVARRTPDWVSPEDLVSAAMVGLAEAAERYDVARAEPFVGFAEKRIRGAVLDELRRGDILPRRVRAKARRVSRTLQTLENELGRRPEDEEIAAALEVSVEEYREDLEALSEISFVEMPASEREDGAGFATAAEDSPIAEVERKLMVQRVKEGITRLAERDAQILSLYYVEEFTYSEIGRILGVSESRVCQLHSRALLRLRAEVGEAEAV
ncbi:MAG: FliA/WhiG family RNA polymerase sigma factor [Myxococcota bacterium]